MAKEVKHQPSLEAPESGLRLLKPLFKIPPPWPSLLWLAMASFLFLLPAKDTPDLDLPQSNLDKVVHALLFLGILVLVARDIIRKGKSEKYLWTSLLLLSIVLFFYGLAIEYLQEQYLNRDGNLPDLIADMVGLVLGLLLLKPLRRWFPSLFV